MLTFSGHQRRGDFGRCGIRVRNELQLGARLQLVLWPQARNWMTVPWSGLTSMRKFLHTRYKFSMLLSSLPILSVVQDHAMFHVPEPSERLSDIIQDKLRDRAARNPLVAPGERKYGITVVSSVCQVNQTKSYRHYFCQKY